MKILIIGQGAREHAILKGLQLSFSKNEFHVVPGNDGMKVDQAICHYIPTTSFSDLWNLVQKIGIELTIIGPEAELALGLSDFLRKKGISVFGPSQAGAQLESSKIFAKKFMKKAQIPTARYSILTSTNEAMKEAQSFCPPYVLKADGLAAGKGVVICWNQEDLKKYSKLYFEDQIFGEAGKRALLEEFQEGEEISAFALTNGKDYSLLPFFQDHKKLLDYDKGPNTGGMGVVGPLFLRADLKEEIQKKIIEPTIRRLYEEKIFYRGVLYFGLMMTQHGPKLLEYNVRFGDPEAQALFPLLDGSWKEVFVEVSKGKIPQLHWKTYFSACVVLAAKNYPQNPIKGTLINGELFNQDEWNYFLHAGTKRINGKWVTSGGRVLSSVALGKSLKEAISNAYKQSKKVSWEGLQMRTDIGKKKFDTFV